MSMTFLSTCCHLARLKCVCLLANFYLPEVKLISLFTTRYIATLLQKLMVSAKRSPLAELLVYSTPTQRVSKMKSARMLTSAESIVTLEEKACKK